ncbi:MAG: hypothetical protein KHZ92_11200 [Ruminococcus bicirculans]|nr:hypothetical protein [Ruminococcus bicirculans (ex Wegman et al. 2014)]
MSELTHCSICGCALEDEAECYEVENEILCQDCYDNETVVCDHCGERCIEQNTVSDENTILCTDCHDIIVIFNVIHSVCRPKKVFYTIESDFVYRYIFHR